ncbi:hypothetical protein [Desulfoplanes formicivorans]|uniref:Uncharacterized protein n=1 Tax=Desulfoplanes formicivorans TaxID=1592317 RepID=A0A194AI31_9BACT|nr:hypothetical protein [Desulfoplanes formicivorans]GAU08885.1 hypothetical protein DPF_1602 [Desulfoplanes formicivorans]
MGQWLDRFDNHPVHGQIQSFEQLIASAEGIVDEIEDTNAIESYERLKLILDAIKSKFDSIDPLLFPAAPLQNLNNQIRQVVSEINAFNSNGNVGHLTNANNHADNVLVNLSNIVSPSLPRDIDGIRESVTSFRRSAGQFIRNLEVEHNDLAAKYEAISQQFEGITAEINTQKGRLDTAITQFQQQFSEAEDRRREQFEQAKDKRKEDYETLVGDIEESFNSNLEKLQEKFQSLLDAVKESRDKAHKELTLSAEEIIKQIEKQKEKASELVTIITNSGMVGGYQTVANKAKTSSIIWQVIAVLSFLGLIAFAIVAFKATFSETLHWGKVGARVFVAITFGILAAYAARQADKHEEAERKNRKMELELAAIDPYLSELPVETRHKIKEELASRLFAQSENSTVINGSKTSGSIVDLLRMALESIDNLSKKSGS